LEFCVFQAAKLRDGKTAGGCAEVALFEAWKRGAARLDVMELDYDLAECLLAMDREYMGTGTAGVAQDSAVP
jgi:hypothetical protein